MDRVYPCRPAAETLTISRVSISIFYWSAGIPGLTRIIISLIVLGGSYALAAHPLGRKSAREAGVGRHPVGSPVAGRRPSHTWCQLPISTVLIFDNIAHRRIIAVYHANPFKVPASNLPLDPFTKFAGWPKAISAYGPLWEDAAGLLARRLGNGMVPNILGLKIFPGILWLACSVVGSLHPPEAFAGERSLSKRCFSWPGTRRRCLRCGATATTTRLSSCLSSSPSGPCSTSTSPWPSPGPHRRHPGQVHARPASPRRRGRSPSSSCPPGVPVSASSCAHRPRLSGVGAGGEMSLFLAGAHHPSPLTAALTSSDPIGAAVYYALSKSIGTAQAGHLVGPAAAALTIGFALWMAYRAWRSPAPDRFALAAMLTLASTCWSRCCFSGPGTPSG